LGWGDGKAEAVDKGFTLPFPGTHCALDSSTGSNWSDH